MSDRAMGFTIGKELPGTMLFEALIVKNNDPMVGTRVYVEAETIDAAMDKVYEQRPADYYTAWVQPYTPPTLSNGG